MRHLPPGRTSRLSMRALWNPFGFHQCTRCSGRVHASQTSPTGASNTRVTTRFRSFLAADMLLLLSLDLAQIDPQAIQAVLPELAVALQPLHRVLERHGLDAAGAALGVTPARDEARALQHLEVLGDRGKGHVERFGQL